MAETLILTRLALKRDRWALQFAGNRYGVHAQLAAVWEGEPRLLWRLEHPDAWTTQILVQAAAPASAAALEQIWSIQKTDELCFPVALVAGGLYRFRLQANVVTCSARSHKRLAVTKQLDQQQWLERQLATHGAALKGLEVQQASWHASYNKDVAPLVHFRVLFQGVLMAMQADRLERAVRCGIGPAKGLGFGLLSLRRVG